MVRDEVDDATTLHILVRALDILVRATVLAHWVTGFQNTCHDLPVMLKIC